MDYNEMIGFIVKQFKANHYGKFIKDGKVFDYASLCLVPNGIDIEMVYRDIGSICGEGEYPFEKHRFNLKEVASRVVVRPSFWKMLLEEVFTDFEDVCFDRFEDWTARSMFKTDTANTRVIHVRFEVPEPMSEEDFIKWARSQNHPDFVLAEFNTTWFGIPFSVSGIHIIREMKPIVTSSASKLGKHDWTPRDDRVDRYNSGSYSDYDEWCDYLDEVCGRD